MAKKRVYVVFKCRQPGIYSTWFECQQQVNEFKDNLYQSYPIVEEAEIAYCEFIERLYKESVQEIPMHQNLKIAHAHINSNKNLVVGFILGYVVEIFFMSVFMYYLYQQII